jgi:hypothetical protein
MLDASLRHLAVTVVSGCCTSALKSERGRGAASSPDDGVTPRATWAMREMRRCFRRAEDEQKTRGLISIRWALWFSLFLVLVFALTTGYSLGEAYVEQLLMR